MNKEQLIHTLNKEHFILAIDGRCGSGKTTLARELHEIFGGNLFHMDDFYLPLELRTKERYAQPGGNVHYERFLETVLLPLSRHQDVDYQVMDCETLSLRPFQHIPYHPYNIIEGSYALHPALEKYYTDVIVLHLSYEERCQRLREREPDSFEMFLKKWIPLEDLYFDEFHIEERYPRLEIEDRKE